MRILLVGRGNMAAAVQAVCTSRGIVRVDFNQDFELTTENHNRTVAIHFGSGSQLPRLIEYCERYRIPIIQGSTGLQASIPNDCNTVIINAPNLSIPMIRFMTAFPAFAREIGIGMEMGVIESHQKDKRDVSGTARAIMRSLDIPDSSIISIRDPDQQIVLGVPRDHLDGHAHHDFIFTRNGIEIKVSTRINGRETYAEGAILLAHALCDLKEPLRDGVHELRDILHLLPRE
jgi:4-hydroxy-tetrahydrodipicolinate reductase